MGGEEEFPAAGKVIVRDVIFRNLAISHLSLPGGRTTIMGHNGSGKTSLLACLAGIAIPEAGTISIGGLPPRSFDVGWIPEFPDRCITFTTAKDEIASPLRFQSLPCEEVDRRVRAITEVLGIHRLLTRAVRELSGGEKALVALATALITAPRILIMDEFDSHLDRQSVERMYGLIDAWGLPFIIHSTQDPRLALTAKTLVIMEKGRVVGSGPPGELFTSTMGAPYAVFPWEHVLGILAAREGEGA